MGTLLKVFNTNLKIMMIIKLCKDLLCIIKIISKVVSLGK